jgi:hypothetical protein
MKTRFGDLSLTRFRRTGWPRSLSLRAGKMPRAARDDRRCGPFCVWEPSSQSIELVSLHLHLMHLVVVLDTEASHNGKPVGAK